MLARKKKKKCYRKSEATQLPDMPKRTVMYMFQQQTIRSAVIQIHTDISGNG